MIRRVLMLVLIVTVGAGTILFAGGQAEGSASPEEGMQEDQADLERTPMDPPPATCRDS